MKERKLTQEEIEQYGILKTQLSHVTIEMREFAKKSPLDNLNILKIQIINRILNKIKALLADEPTVDFLDVLNEEKLPNNSDAVIILGQYTAALQQFRNKYSLSLIGV